MSDKGLVGGRVDLRAMRGHDIPLEHPAVFDLYGENAEEERERARRFIECDTALVVEIGFGHGRFLAALAKQQPEKRHVGFEVRGRWCKELLERSDKAGVDNVRVIRGDVRAIMPGLIPAGRLEAIYVLFPDPWWKKRHHKRRLFTSDTLELWHEKLVEGGAVWFKTDVPMTAALADEEFAGAPGWKPGDPAPFDAWPRTHREERCHKVGLPVIARRFVKVER